MSADGLDAAAEIHPSAVIDAGAVVGAGTRVWHFSHVMAGARIGAGCVLGQNVFVGGGVVVGDRCRIANNVSLYDGVVLEAEVFVGPSVVFTNVRTPRAFVSRKHDFRPTRVGRGATLGANATVVCGRVLGPYCFVAAGAVVTADVAPYALVVGVPARQKGWVCLCGEPLDVPAGPSTRGVACGHCSARFRLEPAPGDRGGEALAPLADALDSGPAR